MPSDEPESDICCALGSALFARPVVVVLDGSDLVQALQIIVENDVQFGRVADSVAMWKQASEDPGRERMEVEGVMFGEGEQVQTKLRKGHYG